jgi:hypothetical protein
MTEKAVILQAALLSDLPQLHETAHMQYFPLGLQHFTIMTTTLCFIMKKWEKRISLSGNYVKQRTDAKPYKGYMKCSSQ